MNKLKGLIPIAYFCCVISYAQSNWTIIHEMSPGKLFTGVAASGNQIVVVGSNGLNFTLVDGLERKQVNSVTTNSLTSITWGGNLFVAVGERGTIISSSEGL